MNLGPAVGLVMLCWHGQGAQGRKNEVAMNLEMKTKPHTGRWLLCGSWYGEGSIREGGGQRERQACAILHE